MRLEVVPVTSFLHDRIDAKEGQPFTVESSLAEALERAGLVRIKAATILRTVVEGPNLQAAGVAQQSSASPVAPASQATIATLFKRGPGRPKKAT